VPVLLLCPLSPQAGARSLFFDSSATELLVVARGLCSSAQQPIYTPMKRRPEKIGTRFRHVLEL
jgi:hypothetical protein